ncbi:TCP-1/cpn60 chaperonin family protein [Streptomyces capillispiralis]|uniref:caspase, EACC1-associated type n=1 Tax=Streptomyces capillispiralis TaxID=68182 RepID=UPI00369B697A
MSRRKALLIATATYEDPQWNPLKAPLRDAEELAAVLGDPAIGGYEVTQVLDQPAYAIQRHVQRFFNEAWRDDELLVYFSCHGIKDYDEKLYFAGTDTVKEPDLLESYAVPAEFVSRQLQRCRAERKVLVLDCCFSGAFRLGAKGDGADLDLRTPFRGSGTVVISATDETQPAFETVSAEGDSGTLLSVFTAALVEGLRTGAADVDGDGRVSVEDLYRYVSREMRAGRTRQTPKLWILDGVGSLVLARRGRGGEKPGPPVPEDAALSSGGPVTRVVPALPARDPVTSAVPVLSPAAEVLAGLSAVAGLLRHTVGPGARPLLISRPDGSVAPLTDPAVITREVVVQPGGAATGARLVRDLVDRMRQRAGDGAATAALVLDASLRHLQPALDDGTSPALLARAVPGTFRRAETLLGNGRSVETKEEIADIVVTTLRDPRLGEVVADALNRVGREGVLVVQESATPGLELLRVEGMVVPGGCLSPHFLTDKGAGTAVLDDPRILLHKGVVPSRGSLLALVEKVRSTGRPLLVIAEGVDDEALSALLVGKKGAFTSIAVKGPDRSRRGLDLLGDLAALTGGEVVAEDTGPGLGDVTPDMLGRARRVLVTEDHTTVDEGAGSLEQMHGRIDSIRADMENSDSDADRAWHGERMARLAGAVAVVRVGAPTPAERERKTADLHRATRLAKAAVADGVVPGAAAALAVAGGRLVTPANADPDAARAAANTLAQALAHGLVQPLRAVADNSGDPDGTSVLVMVRSAWPHRTYDAATATFPETSAAGVLDPVSVPRTVLREVARSVEEYLSLL